MDPKFLIQLAIVVELGSVTKAAQQLNLTQPTLSRSIRVIEDRVGAKVLRRTRHGVSPTEIGARLAEEGREILRHSRQAQTAIRNWRNGLSGDLRVGLGPMMAAGVMGEYISATVDRPVRQGMRLVTDVPSILLESLRANLIDVAILPYDLNRPEDGLHRDMLFDDQLSVFVGRHDPLAGQCDVPALALAGHHWITVGDTAGIFDVTLPALGLPDVMPRIENSGDVTITLRLLEETRACAVLPLRQTLLLQSRYGISPVSLTMPLPKRNVGFWTTATARDRPEIEDLYASLTRFMHGIGLRREGAGPY
ncbi:MAG: LysR family transcriptional regulator [Paracoccaceae bacterium]